MKDGLFEKGDKVRVKGSRTGDGDYGWVGKVLLVYGDGSVKVKLDKGGTVRETDETVELITNSCGFGAVARNALLIGNASGKSIVGKLKALMQKDDYLVPSYWDKLSVSEWDDAILSYLRSLPKKQWTKTQIEERMKDEIGFRASLRFSTRWEQYFWQLDDNGNHFKATTTLGLQCLTVV